MSLHSSITADIMAPHYAKALAQAEAIEQAAIVYANVLRRTGGIHSTNALHSALALRIATEELDTVESLRDQLGIDVDGYPLDAPENTAWRLSPAAHLAGLGE